MRIISFAPNADSTALVLILADAVSASSLKIWKKDDYKDYSKAIDLSSQLTSTASQTINITPAMLGEKYISGIYLIELEDNLKSINKIGADYTIYEECILHKLHSLKLCDDCLNNESLSLLNAQALLTGLKMSVGQGFIEEAKNIENALKKFCSNDCRTCGKYNNILDNKYYDY